MNDQLMVLTNQYLSTEYIFVWGQPKDKVIRYKTEKYPEYQNVLAVTHMQIHFTVL